MNKVSKGKEIFASFLDQIKDYYPHREAESLTNLVLSELLNFSMADRILDKTLEISDRQWETLRQVARRLQAQEPVQYILGYTTFRSRKFRVNGDVLIPRPETEELIELIVRENQTSGLKVLDIGTGSGCIAVSLALELSAAHVQATDVSEAAIALANENARHFQASVQFRRHDILEEVLNHKEFDLVVSTLYIYL